MHLLGTNVCVHRKPEPLPDEIHRIKKKSVLSKMLFTGEVKKQLEKVKADLTNAVDNFRVSTVTYSFSSS